MRTLALVIASATLLGIGVAFATAGGTGGGAPAPSNHVAPDGLIECPLTGELIRPTDCPLCSQSEPDSQAPSCCRKGS